MLVTILIITKYLRGFLANVAVLLGIIAGFLVALALGKVSFAGTGDVAGVALIYPFQFGAPTFDPISVATMCLVMIVVMRIARHVPGAGCAWSAASFCSRLDCSRKWLTWLRGSPSSCWAARAS